MELRLTSSSRRQFLRGTIAVLALLAASPAMSLYSSWFAGSNPRSTKPLTEPDDIIVVDGWVLKRSDVSDVD